MYTFYEKKTKHHLINIGSGKYFSIEHYAKKILKILIPNKKVMIKYEKLKLNGTPKKVLDVSLAKKLGWYAKSNFENSIIQTYKSFLKKIN